MLTGYGWDCKGEAILFSRSSIGFDNESGKNESYGAEMTWNLKCQQAQRLKKLSAH